MAAPAAWGGAATKMAWSEQVGAAGAAGTHAVPVPCAPPCSACQQETRPGAACSMTSSSPHAHLLFCSSTITCPCVQHHHAHQCPCNLLLSAADCSQVDEEEEQNGPLDQAFPTLGEAVKVVQKVGKKKTKGTTLSLNEFMTAPVQRPGVFAAGSAARGAVRATEEKSIMLSLPTGSRGKVEGEEQPSGGLGGAFSQYGGDRGRGEWGRS